MRGHVLRRLTGAIAATTLLLGGAIAITAQASGADPRGPFENLSGDLVATISHEGPECVEGSQHNFAANYTSKNGTAVSLYIEGCLRWIDYTIVGTLEIKTPSGSICDPYIDGVADDNEYPVIHYFMGATVEKRYGTGDLANLRGEISVDLRSTEEGIHSPTVKGSVDARLFPSEPPTTDPSPSGTSRDVIGPEGPFDCGDQHPVETLPAVRPPVAVASAPEPGRASPKFTG